MRQAILLMISIFFIVPSDLMRAQTGSVMNPAISVIGNFGGRYVSDATRHFDLYFEEAELSLRSSVDPYASADFYFSYHKTEDGEYHAELEEAYISTLSLPLDLKIRAGRYRLSVGRLNLVHPHALPFIDLPLASAAYFGEGGLADEGISVSWLVPNGLGFYQELILEAGNTPTESPLFHRPESDRYLFLAHLKNFWELDENSTFELGLSGMTGPNHQSGTTAMAAADLTYKWKPLQMNRYRSLVWQSEFFFNRFGTETLSTVETWGMYSFITYQISQRWFFTGRFDYANDPLSASVAERGYSGTLGWYASEFQKIEVGGTLMTGNTHQDRTGIMLRWIFVIGAHGAHQY